MLIFEKRFEANRFKLYKYISYLTENMNPSDIINNGNPADVIDLLAEDELKECIRLYLECMPLRDVWDFILEDERNNHTIIENLLGAININHNSIEEMQKSYMNLSYSMIDAISNHVYLIDEIRNFLSEKLIEIVRDEEEAVL